MGAGSSTEQRSPERPPAGSDTPTGLELGGDGPAAEATPGADADPAIADADPASKGKPLSLPQSSKPPPAPEPPSPPALFRWEPDSQADGGVEHPAEN